MAEPIPPPYVISDNDKRGLIVVITGTTLSFVWTCLLIRIWLRYKTREWKSDDYFLAAATILDTVQSGLVFHAVDEGLGQSQNSLNAWDLGRIGKDDLAAQILYVLTLFFSKCAVLFLYLRLSPRRGHAVASYATIALSAAWTVIAIILIAVACNTADFWDNGIDNCAGIAAKWVAIGTLDIVSEVCIFLISVYLVARLNMGMKSKLIVVAAFSARLPVIAVAAVRLYYIESTFSSPDRTLDATYYFVSTQCQLGYAIMSTTITGLGPFLRPFSKSYTTSSYRHSSYANAASLPASSTNRSNLDSQQDSHNSEQAESYQLDSIHARTVPIVGRKGSTTTSGHLSAFQDTYAGSSQSEILPQSSGLQLRPDADALKRDTAIYGGHDVDDEDVMSRMSDESRRMIITKKTELRIEHDRRSVVIRRQSKGDLGAV